MSGVNRAIIVGHLGKDPETRSSQGGMTITNFSVATSETWKDKKTGEKREQTEWHRISTFGRLAEICAQYLEKGKLVYIEGRIQTRSWEDKEGNKRYTTEIIANNMQILGGGGEKREAPKKQKTPPKTKQAEPEFDDSQIPF